MDSITQAVLGASVAAFIAPKEIRKSALLAGAMLGTLPDLDVLIYHSNAVDRFTYHRGFSHSLFLLSILPMALMPIFRRFFKSFRILSNWRLYFFIMLPLTTHALLDALTSYGTQLFYPLPTTPVFISSVFIVDLFYTSWLILGVFLYLYSPSLRWSNSLALILSSAYLVFGFGMQNLAKNQLVEKYPETDKKQWFVGALTATPFCWHAVYKKDTTYLETAFNVLNPNYMASQTYEILASENYPNSKDLKRLLWFNPNTSLREKNGELISSDLRMGEFGLYNFEFIIKPDTKSGEQLSWTNKEKWQPISENQAAKEYEQKLSQDKNPISAKWHQVGRCLTGGI